VGGFRPDMREADDDAIRRARVFVDTRDGAGREAGGIDRAIETGALGVDGIAADLFELCADDHPGRTADDEITLFKSVGTAIEDLAARYEAQGKTLQLRHLSRDCHQLLTRAGQLMVDADDDPDYGLAVDYGVKTDMLGGAH